MNNFLFGYFLGSSGDNESGDGGGGSGCGCILLILFLGILYFIFHLIAGVLGLSESGLLNNIITGIKYYFYPALWDYYHSFANESNGLKFWLMLGNVILVSIIAMILGGFFALLGSVFKIEPFDDNSFLSKLSFGLILVLIVPNLFLIIGRAVYYLFKAVF